MSEEGNVGRRRIVNWLLGTSIGSLAASVLYPVARYLSPPNIPEATTNQVEAGNTSDPELLERGFKIVRFGQEPVILLHTDDDDYRAFSATCTHLDCIVEFQDDKQRIWCNCHNGHYNLNGQVVAGPPPRPLTPYQVDLVDAGTGQPRNIVITKV